MFIFHIHDYVKNLNRWREVKERSEKELWPALSGNLLKKVPITCHCSTNAPKPTRLLDLFFLQNISFEMERVLQNFTYCMNGSRSVPLFQFFPCLELFGYRSQKTLRKFPARGKFPGEEQNGEPLTLLLALP